VNLYLRNYLIPKWGTCAASGIKRADIRDWLYDLRDNENTDLEGPTVSKIKSVMGTIYNFGIFEEIVAVNPCAGWRLQNVKSTHVPVTVTPEQAKAIIGLLGDPRHKMLVLVCASTAVRASEACGLKWRDIDWAMNQIRIERRWTAADLDEPKTKRSKAPVPLHPVLAYFLVQWRSITPYGGDDDWVFPSFKMSGTIPMCAGIFVTDYLRAAAVAAGVEIKPEQKFGLHSFRSSLATWIVSIDKSDPKTAQGILRHENIETTLGPYAQVVQPEAIAAQGRYLEACGLGVGQRLLPDSRQVQ
jgi:integrase